MYRAHDSEVEEQVPERGGPGLGSNMVASDPFFGQELTARQGLASFIFTPSSEAFRGVQAILERLVRDLLTLLSGEKQGCTMQFDRADLSCWKATVTFVALAGALFLMRVSPLRADDCQPAKGGSRRNRGRPPG